MWLDNYIWNPGTPMLCHRCHNLLLVFRCFVIASIRGSYIRHFCWQLELRTGVCSGMGWAWPFCKADLSIRWQLVLHDHGTAEPGHFEKADEFWRLLWCWWFSSFNVEICDLWLQFALFSFVVQTLIQLAYECPHRWHLSAHHIFFLQCQCALRIHRLCHYGFCSTFACWR